MCLGGEMIKSFTKKCPTILIVSILVLILNNFQKDKFFINCKYVASSSSSSSSTIDKPLLLLISFDGFRWDYLNKYKLKNFNKLKNEGSSSDYIINSFATITFPNHWTIVTGLFEETHGLISNEMYDITLNDTFNVNKHDSEQIQWYGQNELAEPIWITNQKAQSGRLSAAEWIGSDVKFSNQTIISIPYNRSTDYKDYINQFMNLFTREKDSINFGALYFDEPGLF
jgi:ectonucleotide pyrophosphatase/phosphodiesterase family member 5